MEGCYPPRRDSVVCQARGPELPAAQIARGAHDGSTGRIRATSPDDSDMEPNLMEQLFVQEAVVSGRIANMTVCSTARQTPDRPPVSPWGPGSETQRDCRTSPRGDRCEPRSAACERALRVQSRVPATTEGDEGRLWPRVLLLCPATRRASPAVLSPRCGTFPPARPIKSRTEAARAVAANERRGSRSSRRLAAAQASWFVITITSIPERKGGSISLS